jgi:hypothetical protein
MSIDDISTNSGMGPCVSGEIILISSRKPTYPEPLALIDALPPALEMHAPQIPISIIDTSLPTDTIGSSLFGFQEDMILRTNAGMDPISDLVTRIGEGMKPVDLYNANFDAKWADKTEFGAIKEKEPKISATELDLTDNVYNDYIDEHFNINVLLDKYKRMMDSKKVEQNK